MGLGDLPSDHMKAPVKYVTKEKLQALWDLYGPESRICRSINLPWSYSQMIAIWNFEESCWWIDHPEDA